MIAQRISRLWRAVVGSGLTELEAHHAEEMLDLERESLRAQLAKYNQGLAGYAALVERLRAEQLRLEKERSTLEPKLRTRLAAQDRAQAGKHALRLQAIAEREAAIRSEMETTDLTYRDLVRAREVALLSARERIESLKRSIDECKVQEALADLTEMSAGMQGSIGLSDGTLDRIRERVDERKHYAAGRARVARDAIDVEGVRTQQAEQEALADEALRRYEAELGAERPHAP